MLQYFWHGGMYKGILQHPGHIALVKIIFRWKKSPNHYLLCATHTCAHTHATHTRALTQNLECFKELESRSLHRRLLWQPAAPTPC